MNRNSNHNSQTQGRKEREWELRRQEILDAAQKIFEKGGYFNATMAQIASEAEFGVGTLYQFFPNKQGLFAEVILREVESFMQGLRDLLSTRSLWQEQLKLFVEYKLTWVDKRPEFQRLVMEIFYAPIHDVAPQIIDEFKELHMENLQILQDIFIQANKDGYTFDPDLMSIATMGTLNAIASDWYMGLLKKAPIEYISGVLNGILGGKRDV
ncbi:MAG: TetR/AcrR family transcriptional regulator [Deltaproteobacteria bacterium]|nr:TetR/AcrR family transcriptional regulator [Deltaproteobacteria bacterium]